ncbi:MAG TPA: tyrosine-protein phosphatase [Microbacterium sp.]|nr:tyrosine-protein phosphatase [Microbacterium sp.]
MTVLEIEGVTGFRDVGGIPADGGTIRNGILFRSGHLAGLGAIGADALRNRVRHIVDLRADDEVAADVTTIDDIPITRLPLYLGSARSFFLEDYTLGEIYAHLLAGAADRLVEAVRIIAAGAPTLVHCTAGKDRTGITIALALAAAGADREGIVADYALTGELIPVERRRATSERLARTYPQSQHAWMLATESPAEVMRETLEDVDAEWGSASSYLRAHGLSGDELNALRAALVEPASTPSSILSSMGASS